jgi:hypothetical protein
MSKKAKALIKLAIETGRIIDGLRISVERGVT